MMPGDSAELAQAEAEAFDDERIVHAWDPDRRLGDLFARTLKLHSTAWDVYFLYGPGVRWQRDEPPEPAFWMHQLGVETGVAADLLLDPTRLYQELVKLLGNAVEPSSPNLGLVLHAKGLASLTRERA